RDKPGHDGHCKIQMRLPCPGEEDQGPRCVDRCRLNHPEHDGADEGHGEVGGDNAQSAGERHEVGPSVRVAWRAALMVNRKSLFEKVRLAVARHRQQPVPLRPVWLKNTEINTLKSL
ncbi:hypothetical protein, partial [Bradyrhizobium yuanmingense]|uniref:hypothetical protein n=1 Tax=Bradyrhizobium yuanmingense TaxID=108015 RepID=UPI001AEC6989